MREAFTTSETLSEASTASRVLKSTCRMCHGGCSTLLHVRDGKLLRIEGDPTGPLNHGRLCPMGHASLELVRSPARLTHPLIRAGARGDWVTIASPRGSIRQRALLSADILPGVIHCEHGWWFPEREDPEHGAFESNANVLTSQSPPYDPAMGTYQLRGLLCRIERA